MGTVVLQQAVSTSASWLELASDLLRTVFMLGAVCALAWFVLRAAAARGLGKASRSARMEVIERLALDAQRSVYLVRVEQRRLVIGVGHGAAPQLLTELDAKSVTDGDVAAVATELDLVHAASRRDATH
jgi:flagellar biosynthetic protein FliO